MPRIRPSVIRQALSIDRALPRLLPVCHGLPSARNELRWLAEHAVAVAQHLGNGDEDVRPRTLLDAYVRRRAGGEPLQYILGSEYFGDLEIKCRPGVLIPRSETAVAVARLARLVKQQPNPAPALRVLDLCTGSGCIPLLFHHEFYQRGQHASRKLELVGVDISGTALSLARENLIHQIVTQARTQGGNAARMRALHGIGFVQADILRDEMPDTGRRASREAPPPSLVDALRRIRSSSDPQSPIPAFDILISNPPYISPAAFRHTTARSVRDFEPRLALVPSRPDAELDQDVGDYFYPRLLQVAEMVQARAVLLEVADLDQAKRVAALALQSSSVGSKVSNWKSAEIWRDEPDAHPTSNGESETVVLHGNEVCVRGHGNGRTVLLWRNEAQDILDIDA